MWAALRYEFHAKKDFMRVRSGTTHHMLFCQCGWEEDVFLAESMTVQKAVRFHRKTCSEVITGEKAVVTKYKPKHEKTKS